MRPRENEFGIFTKNIRDSIIFYYWVYDPDTDKRVFRTTGKRTRDEAVKYCRNLQIKGELYNKTVNSFSTYTENFYNYDKCPYIRHRLNRGYDLHRAWAKRLKRILDTEIRPYFKEKQIGSISINDIDNFVLSLKKQRKSNKTINHIITALKNIFNFAEMNGSITINPCKGLKPFRVDTPKKGILSKEEYSLLFGEEKKSQIWTEQMHYVINYLAACSGLRIGEIMALQPQDISDNKLVISHSYSPDDGLKSTKNGKKRIIPLDTKLEELLKSYCLGKKKDDYIFSCNDGKSPICHKTIYKSFKSALYKIGINEEERKRRNISFHSYRHGVNTYLLESGMAPETVRLITGHSGTSMTKRYAHLEMPDVSKLIFKTEEDRNKINNVATPNYIKELIDKGLLFPDGKRVVKALDIVACEMQNMMVQPTEQLLSELFLKANGESYSKKACKNAVNCANAA